MRPCSCSPWARMISCIISGVIAAFSSACSCSRSSRWGDPSPASSFTPSGLVRVGAGVRDLKQLLYCHFKLILVAASVLDCAITAIAGAIKSTFNVIASHHHVTDHRDGPKASTAISSWSLNSLLRHDVDRLPQPLLARVHLGTFSGQEVAVRRNVPPLSVPKWASTNIAAVSRKVAASC